MSTKKGWKSFNFNYVNGTSKNIKKDNFPKQIFKTQSTSFNFDEKIVPQSVDDLAVHTRKISDVEFWLNNNVITKSRNHKPSVLLITGPTGCGKTATVKVLCKKLDIEVSEWINPIDRDKDYAIGQTSQILEFLSQSKYPSLLCMNKPKVILIEDFPNSVIYNPNEMVTILEKCTMCEKSVIFICTELSNLNINLPQTLFPDELRQQFSIYNISFNATSTTLMTKAVKRAKNIIEMHTEINSISDATVDDIVCSSMGDIRCAVNQVYFTCSKVCSDLLPSTPPPISSRKRKRKSKNDMKNQIMLKNERLSFFHGIGRVLNPKRVEKNGSWRLKCDIQALIDEIGIQPSTFNSFVHNNYIKYFGDIHDISNAAEILSFSQMFLNKWENRENFLNYSLWIPIMGLMVYNEHKVLKWNQITAPRKYKKALNNDMEMKSLNVVDRCYYNIINKLDLKNQLKPC